MVYVSLMESEPTTAAAKLQLDALAQAEAAARSEMLQSNEPWTIWVAALVGPMIVAAEASSGALQYLIAVIFALVLGALAVREARKMRIRRRLGFLPGKLGRFHFGFIFVFILSINLVQYMVDRVSNVALAAISYGVYVIAFKLWLVAVGRMIGVSAPEQVPG